MPRCDARAASSMARGYGVRSSTIVRPFTSYGHTQTGWEQAHGMVGLIPRLQQQRELREVLQMCWGGQAALSIRRFDCRTTSA